MRRALVAVLVGVPAMLGVAPAQAAGNTPPDVPTDLAMRPSVDCGAYPATAMKDDQPTFLARVRDADGDVGLSLRWELRRYGSDSVTNVVQGHLINGAQAELTPQRPLAEGRYTWRVRAEDGQSASAWSGTCRFVVALDTPGEPQVHSELYPENRESPEGGVGVPGRFVFGADAATGVVAFEYAVNGNSRWTSVPADPQTHRGSALIAPAMSGSNVLDVRSVNRVGYRGPSYRYDFAVRRPTPVVWWPMDEPSGPLAHDVVGSRDLVVSGVARGPGRFALSRPDDRALAFDGEVGGADLVTGPAALDPSTSFTMIVSVRPGTLDRDRTVFTQLDADGGAAFRLGYDADTGRYVAELAVTGEGAPVVTAFGEGTPWFPSSWQTLAVVYDQAAANLKLYEFCSEQIVGVPVGGTPVGGRGEVRLGSGGAAADWDGSIDDVRITRAALPQIDVAEQCNDATPPPPPG